MWNPEDEDVTGNIFAKSYKKEVVLSTVEKVTCCMTRKELQKNKGSESGTGRNRQEHVTYSVKSQSPSPSMRTTSEGTWRFLEGVLEDT